MTASAASAASAATGVKDAMRRAVPRPAPTPLGAAAPAGTRVSAFAPAYHLDADVTTIGPDRRIIATARERASGTESAESRHPRTACEDTGVAGIPATMSGRSAPYRKDN